MFICLIRYIYIQTSLIYSNYNMTNKNFVPLEESQKNKKSIIEYNNRTEQSYIKNNFETPEYLDYQEKNFLSKVDVENYPIERTVTRIVRTRAQDITSKKKEYK